jgi:hypothetical protein
MVNTSQRGPKLMLLVAVLAGTVLISDLGASAQQAPEWAHLLDGFRKS